MKAQMIADVIARPEGPKQSRRLRGRSPKQSLKGIASSGFALLATASVLICAIFNPVYAQDAERKERPQTQGNELQEAIARPRFAPGEVLFYADIYEGYDNNVNLDSLRRGDLFTETYAEIGYRQAVSDAFSATIDYYLTTVNYHEMTDATFYDNNVALDLDIGLFDGAAVFLFGNKVGYNYYPNEEASTYLAYNSRAGIRHNFNRFASQRLFYDFTFRDYTDRKAQDGRGVSKGGDRQDIRNSVTYELAGLFFKDFFLKLSNQYFVNDSNDQYMDYYDYWSYRVSATAILPVFILPVFRERLYGLISAGYQRIDYDTRRLVNDTSRTERDDLYSVSSSLIFDLTKKISISLNYSYRQNESNEPSQEYSGSIVSAGFHYAF